MRDCAEHSALVGMGSEGAILKTVFGSLFMIDMTYTSRGGKVSCMSVAINQDRQAARASPRERRAHGVQGSGSVRGGKGDQTGVGVLMADGDHAAYEGTASRGGGSTALAHRALPVVARPRKHYP